MPNERPQPFLQAPQDIKRVVQALKAPVNKVGLVLLRDADGDEPQVCLTQVKAKNPAEQDRVNFGLAKGTRQYRDPKTGEMHDARDFLTAQKYKDHLEPELKTLCNEGEQEIGTATHDIMRGDVKELGERLFAPRDGSTPYDIKWYVMQADAGMQNRMDPQPEDAHAVKWFTLKEVAALADAGKINPDYVKVIAESVDKYRKKELMPASFAPARQLV